MSRKHDPNYIDGFPKILIKRIIDSPNTPVWLKEIWKKKLKESEINVKKVKDVA